MIDQTPLTGEASKETMMVMPMLRLLYPILSLVSLCTLTASSSLAAETKPIVDANTAFACDLYAQLKSRPGNLFLSPYSISTALGMTYAGARGETARQMAEVLHFSQDQAAVPGAFGELQRQLAEAEKQKGIQLNIANALWAQQGHTFLPAFLDITRKDYQANVNQTDFKTSAEAARVNINHWVAQKTQDRIQDLLPPGSLDTLTRLVLANAIYFKGVWATPFPKASTSTQPFHLSATTQADVALMRHLDEVNYLETADFQAVDLPYSGDRLSMVVLLPRQIDGCSQLESRLTPSYLSQFLSQIKKQKVDIILPRFKTECSLELKPTLARMGMTDAVDTRADFSGMDGTRLLFISDVFHKAWVEVNEEGSEAAAATAVVMSVKSMAVPEPRPVFRADHPFVYLIRDTRSASILFLGRLADPRQ
jgi:serpin B